MALTKQGSRRFSQITNAKGPFGHLSSIILGSAETYAKCQYCGCIVNLKEAKISGYDSEHSLRHIHCSGCGRIIRWSPGERSVAGLIQGICGMILGGALAYMLYPHLSIYGLQAGFFTSMYGLLKVLIS